jgi:cytoskeletal protein CcmA (bactofilin family)
MVSRLSARLVEPAEEKEKASSSAIAYPASQSYGTTEAGTGAPAREAARGSVSRPHLFAGRDIEVTGEATFKGFMLVDGIFRGRILSEDGTLVVGASGRVDASILAAVVRVFGAVNGDITAHERLELGPTARVAGNLFTPALIIEQGAVFDGHCRMLAERAAPTAALEEEDDESLEVDYVAEGERLFSMAVELFDESDYGEAIPLFRRVQQLGGAHAAEAQAYLARMTERWDRVRFDEGVNLFKSRCYADARLCFFDVADVNGEHRAEAERYLSEIEVIDSPHEDRSRWLEETRGEESIISLIESTAGDSDEEEGASPFTSFEIMADPLPYWIAVAPEPAATTTVRRTPHLDFLPNEPLQPGTELHAFVYLDTLALREGESGEEATFETEEGGGPLEVDTHLLLTEHFTHLGEAVKTLVVDPEKERTEPVRFDVKIREERELSVAGLLSVPAQLTALFLLNGRPSGSIRRAVQISGIALARPQPAEEVA